MKNNELDAVAAQVIERLKGKVTIHRYDAYSTSSIYLKFDWGVANSLRIADHTGKNHLHYRFNLMLGLKEFYIDESGKFPRRFYPTSQIEQVVADILAAKAEKQEYYRDYDSVVQTAMNRTDFSQGFWFGCREL